MEGDWRKLKPSIGQAMSHILQTGLYTDLTFKVGPTGQQVYAHKVIVMSRSEVFAIMLQERWDGTSADSNRSVIDIPDTSTNGFSYFIKYFYTDELDAETPIPYCLEVLRLAHMYQVPGLMSKCFAFLKSKISVDNCVQIYHGTRLYEEDDVCLMAYDFLTKNIKVVVAKDEFLHLDQQGLMQLLQSDNLAIDEAELFKAVMRWTNHEEHVEQIASMRIRPPRKETLQSLIPLIRFPLMGAEAFAKEVVPTNILSSDEALGIFMFFNGGAAEGLRFSAKPRSPPASTFKRLKCYADPAAFPIQQLETLTSLSFLPQFRFSCNKRITVHGLCFYGPDESSQSINSEYEIMYLISGFETKCQKQLKIKVVNSGDFDLLLDKPFTSSPGNEYSVNLQVKVSDLLVPTTQYCWPLIGSLFRIGKEPRPGGQVLQSEDGVDFRITYPPRNSYRNAFYYGMIESIIYTL